MSNYNVGNIFGFSCTKCEYNRHCYGGDLGNQYKFCQKSREKLENLDELEKENKKYKEVIDKSIKCIDYNNRYRNDADIYQFVDIKGEILEPLKDILEQNEENSNIYLKEFNDWLKEVE